MQTGWQKQRLRGCRLGVTFLGFVALCCSASDWPQFRGSNHNGVSTDRITTKWSGAVTNPIWLVPVTNCLGSLAVSGGRIFTQTRRPVGGISKEICVALDPGTGRELWAATLDDANYPDGGVGYDDGPRTTPAVESGSVFVLTSYLKLYALDATTGLVQWQKDFRMLYGSSGIPWQNAASPVLEGGLLFVNANCATSNLMAFRTSDGSLVWRSQNEPLTHSTPVLATIQGVRQVIFATGNGLVSLDPSTGNLLWKFRYPFAYNVSIGASPVVYQDMVFVTGARVYSMGSVVMQASLTNGSWTTRQLWSTDNPSAHWMTPVCYQGFLYGQFGVLQFDGPSAQLKCVEMRTGAVKWSVDNFGRGATLLVNNQLLSIAEKGQMVLVQPNTNAYIEIARCLAIPGYHDFTNKCWNAPAVSDGRVYVRSTAYVAAFDFSVPALRLDPVLVGADKLQLTVRTVTGAPLDSNRVATLELRAATNLTTDATQWLQATNRLLLTNGVGRVDDVNPQTQPSQFFLIKEAP